jgi:hypothetical protein
MVTSLKRTSRSVEIETSDETRIPISNIMTKHCDKKSKHEKLVQESESELEKSPLEKSTLEKSTKAKIDNCVDSKSTKSPKIYKTAGYKWLQPTHLEWQEEATRYLMEICPVQVLCSLIVDEYLAWSVDTLEVGQWVDYVDSNSKVYHGTVTKIDEKGISVMGHGWQIHHDKSDSWIVRSKIHSFATIVPPLSLLKAQCCIKWNYKDTEIIMISPDMVQIYDPNDYANRISGYPIVITDGSLFRHDRNHTCRHCGFEQQYR